VNRSNYGKVLIQELTPFTVCISVAARVPDPLKRSKQSERGALLRRKCSPSVDSPGETDSSRIRPQCFCESQQSNYCFWMYFSGFFSSFL
jgi:hypothetical protein